MTAQVIYAMTHLPTGKVYVGQTTNDRLTIVNTQRFGPKPGRFAEHLGYLARGDHRNINLQAVWTGNDGDFDFQVIDMVPAGVHPREVETEWIKAFPAVFNIRQCNRSGEKYQRITRAVEDEVVALLKTGMTGQRISDTVGISPASVTIIRKRNGIARVQRSELDASFERAYTDPATYKNGTLNIGGTLVKHDLRGHRTAFVHWIGRTVLTVH